MNCYKDSPPAELAVRLHHGLVLMTWAELGTACIDALKSAGDHDIGPLLDSTDPESDGHYASYGQQRKANGRISPNPVAKSRRWVGAVAPNR